MKKPDKERLLSIRHGEIMLIPVGNIPKGKTEKHNKFIVGHSETGHHHVLEGETFEVTETEKKELYFRLFKPTDLTHQKTTDKHRTLTVPAGIYKRYHDTEYDPYDKIIRNSKD
jgi:hypothetical protein